MTGDFSNNSVEVCIFVLVLGNIELQCIKWQLRRFFSFV